MFVRPWLRPLSFIACLLVLAACVHAPEPVGLTFIVAKNAAATGGGERIQSMEIDLSMQESGKTYDAVYRVTRDGRMRIDILSKGERVYTEAYDGHAGWDQGRGGAAVPDPHGEALWHGTQFPGNIFGLQDLQQNGHRLDYQGRETVEGVDYYVVKLSLSDGFETYRYVNPQSWLMERGRDYRAFHPALDSKETWVETRWSDFRPVEGVMRPFLSVNTDLASGKELARQQVTAYKINPEFDSSVFTVPTARPAMPAL